MQDAEFKLCPYCSEQIRASAVKCRFCGEWFEKHSAPKSGSIQEREENSASAQSQSKPQLQPPSPPPLPAKKRPGWHSLTLAQQVIIAVGFALIAIFYCNSFSILSPLGLGCIVVLVGLFFRFRIPPDRGTEDDGFELLEHAMRLERNGQIQDALKAYEDIAKRYANNAAGSDAQKSADILRRKTG